MKLITFALLSLSLTTYAAEKAKFVLKCSNGSTIRAAKLVVGQDFSAGSTGEEYFGIRLENGVHEPLYRLVGYKNVSCDVEVAK